VVCWCNRLNRWACTVFRTLADSRDLIEELPCARTLANETPSNGLSDQYCWSHIRRVWSRCTPLGQTARSLSAALYFFFAARAIPGVSGRVQVASSEVRQAVLGLFVVHQQRKHCFAGLIPRTRIESTMCGVVEHLRGPTMPKNPAQLSEVLLGGGHTLIRAIACPWISAFFRHAAHMRREPLLLLSGKPEWWITCDAHPGGTAAPGPPPTFHIGRVAPLTPYLPIRRFRQRPQDLLFPRPPPRSRLI